MGAEGEHRELRSVAEFQGQTIPPESLAVIFLAYRQASVAAKRSNEHLGLGLYIASEIVRAHGGSLTVRSEGGSTTFTVRLPRVLPAPPSGSHAG